MTVVFPLGNLDPDVKGRQHCEGSQGQRLELCCHKPRNAKDCQKPLKRGSRRKT